MQEPFDPLNYDNLARSVVTALLEQPISPLPPEEPFFGNGVYAIYYCGKLPFYSGLASAECNIPIYVGKAIPKGGRKGKAESRSCDVRVLYGRLKQHANSISQTSNLATADFRCRYLVVVPVWITLAERFLIGHFQPLWNTVVDGFGNHAVGAGREQGKRPRWDILHPGRSWSRRLKAIETPEQIIGLIANRK